MYNCYKQFLWIVEKLPSTILLQFSLIDSKWHLSPFNHNLWSSVSVPKVHISYICYLRTERPVVQTNNWRTGHIDWHIYTSYSYYMYIPSQLGIVSCPHLKVKYEWTGRLLFSSMPLTAFERLFVKLREYAL